MFRIVEDDIPPLPEDCSDPLQDFLKQCFHKDPELRPDAETLCEHPWLTSRWEALKVYIYALAFIGSADEDNAGTPSSGQYSVPSSCQHRSSKD